MSDLSYISSLSDAAILNRIGAFIKFKRIALNLTQQDVAERAAVSRSTLSLAERGENIALSNLLKILRILDALYVFESFQIPEHTLSPIQLAKEDEKKRKRASGNRNPNDQNNDEW